MGGAVARPGKELWETANLVGVAFPAPTFFAPGLRPASMDTDAEREIARLSRQVVREENLPGLSVAVTDGDETLFADGFGSRDLAGNRPATPETLHGIASCTKSFAGVALLQLAESGICDLDDPVSAYTPVSFDDPEPTLHHLLTHSSGLPSLGVSETLLARRLRLPDPGIPMGDTDDFHAHVDAAGAERTDPPGERFAYCNTGYALLGETVESLTGKSFDEYVRSHVFEPLGMERSTFDDHEFSMADDHMTQYRQTEDGLMASSLPTRDIGQAAGGILSSVTELASYLRLHLNDGAAEGAELLDADMLAQAHVGYVDVPGTTTGREGVLAAAVGEDPGSVPFFRLRRRHRRLAGAYSAYEGVMNATVERDGGTLRVDFDHPLKDGETVLFPAESDGGPAARRADAVYQYETVDSAGRREPVEFRVENGEVSLLIDRWRLRQA